MFYNYTSCGKRQSQRPEHYWRQQTKDHNSTHIQQQELQLLSVHIFPSSWPGMGRQEGSQEGRNKLIFFSLYFFAACLTMHFE